MSDRRPMLSPEEMAFVKGNGFQPHPDAPAVSTPVEEDIPSVADALTPTRKRKSIQAEEREATVRFTLDMRRSQHDELKRAALEARMPMTQLMRHIVADWLAAEE